MSRRVPLLPRSPWPYRLGVLLLYPVLRLLYGLHVHGLEHAQHDGPCVIAANHDSFWDPPVVGISARRYVQFMAKRELFVNPVTNLAFRAVGAFPVDRGRNDIGAVKEALRRLQDGGTVGVFFEGTRRAENKGAMEGAAFLAQRAGATLVPTAIWREGRSFHVQFDAPIRAEGRSREETSALTLTLIARVRALLEARGAGPVDGR